MYPTAGKQTNCVAAYGHQINLIAQMTTFLSVGHNSRALWACSPWAIACITGTLSHVS